MYLVQGHPLDKIELLVLGGTWSEYPESYQRMFVTELFYAANTFFDSIPRREMKSLREEQRINETTRVRIIGLTLETRPDAIDMNELARMREYGCTRVQLGVQHTDDKILKRVNRGCYLKDTVRAMKMIKECGFKLDAHWMTQLPGTTPSMDKNMFLNVLYNPSLQADQWKVYPTAVTPYTVIKRWFENGEYTPYEDKELLEVLLYVKTRVHPWIRLNRVIRDIPEQMILGGNKVVNLRQKLHIELKRRGQRCRCIRCREVRDRKQQDNSKNDAILVRRDYDAQESREIFLSFESNDDDREVLYGFVRLRLPSRPLLNHSKLFPELQGRCALIRELHVYGAVTAVSNRTRDESAQHVGFGQRLMHEAERISIEQGYERVAVIAGIGTREYYRAKCGYELRGTYMMKELKKKRHHEMSQFQLLLFVISSWLLGWVVCGEISSAFAFSLS